MRTIELGGVDVVARGVTPQMYAPACRTPRIGHRIKP
jgi:hypothetical protein